MAGQSGRRELLTLRLILFVAPGSSWFAHSFRCGNGRPNYGGTTTAASPRIRRQHVRNPGMAQPNTGI